MIFGCEAHHSAMSRLASPHMAMSLTGQVRPRRIVWSLAAREDGSRPRDMEFWKRNVERCLALRRAAAAQAYPPRARKVVAAGNSRPDWPVPSTGRCAFQVVPDAVEPFATCMAIFFADLWTSELLSFQPPGCLGNALAKPRGGGARSRGAGTNLAQLCGWTRGTAAQVKTLSARTRLGIALTWWLPGTLPWPVE